MDDRSQGLLLQSIPYLDAHRILKVLTPDSGLITLMARYTQSKSKPYASLITPFLLAEWVYAKDSKEMHLLKDGTLLEDFAPLKLDYNRLAAAGQIAQDLLKTQLPGKPAQLPCELARACLQKLPLFPNPHLLAAAFRLKLLAHEGLLHLQPICTQCHSPTTHLHRGESYCPRHAPRGSHSFSTAEQELYYSRSFAELAAMQLSADTWSKIDALFQKSL